MASEGNPAKIGAIDATSSHGMTDKYKIQSYPTLIPFRGSKPQTKYVGERTTNAIVKFMREGVGSFNTDDAKLTLDHTVEATAEAGAHLLFELSPATAKDLSNQDVKQQILVCANFDSAHGKDLKLDMQKAAAQLHGQYLMLHMNSKSKANSGIIKRVGAKLADCPLLRIASMNDVFTVYKPKPSQDFSVNYEGLLKFADAYEKQQLIKHLRSDPVPMRKPSGPVYNIVGDMYADYVIDPPKDVLIFLYMDGCPYCKSFSQVYLEVAKEIQEMGEAENLQFVKMNGPRNDIDDDAVAGTSYPRVYMYPDEEKNQPIFFSPTSSDDPEVNKEKFKTFIELYSTWSVKGVLVSDTFIFESDCP